MVQCNPHGLPPHYVQLLRCQLFVSEGDRRIATSGVTERADNALPELEHVTIPPRLPHFFTQEVERRFKIYLILNVGVE